MKLFLRCVSRLDQLNYKNDVQSFTIKIKIKKNNINSQSKSASSQSLAESEHGSTHGLRKEDPRTVLEKKFHARYQKGSSTHGLRKEVLATILERKFHTRS